jgi:hypothetical protein
MLNMSIKMVQQKCPSCGAPLSGLDGSIVVCAFCSTELHKGSSEGFRIPPALPPAHPVKDLGLVCVGNVGYRVHGRLAQGSSCDVFLARRNAALTEMVVLKIARERAESVTAEWRIIAELRQRAEGRFIGHLLPQPVGFGRTRCEHRAERTGAVYRWRSGFDFTFEDAHAQYPSGVDPRAAVWMWNRLLEQLGSLHELGYSHGAVCPEHLLIHPRDHGVLLCSWSQSGQHGRATDLADAARCIAYVVSTKAPRILTDLIQRASKFRDAFELMAELKRVATEAFGSPRFHPFTLQA